MMATVSWDETLPQQRPGELTLGTLLAETQRYMAPGDLETIRRAFALANEAHAGVYRRSGEPYIQHPLAVASILASMRIDAAGIAAALLHDVVEDTKYSLEDIRERFGPVIANIVDGVTKFNALEQKQAALGGQAAGTAGLGNGENGGDGAGREPGSPVAEAEDSEPRKKRIRDSAVKQQAETARKMFVAMAEDPRVVVLKLADRLHNMRTLDAMRPAQQQAKAHETREIYAPLAGRLGMSLVKSELEDLAFKYLEPDKYQWLLSQVREEEEQRKSYVDRVCKILREEMARAGIKAEVQGRIKHLYSIYKKILRTGVDVSQIHDLIAFRILVDTVHDCYLALGQIHALWRPKDGRIKDYIATPKPNGYQSLHTTVFCLDERLAEMQIRTHEMHRTAEYGVATHWYYKETGGVSIPRREAMAWIEQLREWQRELSSATEFVESVKDDIFQDQVFVFTPRGDVKDLPVGSTPLDFAYRIHTEIGDHCAGARIITDTERLITRMVSLDYELKGGEIVDIITNKNAHPSRDWLAIAHTANAKQKIRRYLKLHERDIDMQIGRERLDRELKSIGHRGIDSVTDDDLVWLAGEFKATSADDLLVGVGRDEFRAHAVALHLREHVQERENKPPAETKGDELPAISPATTRAPVTVQVAGMSGMLTRIANCCCPIPGDAIMGFVGRGRGVVIHRQDCKNLHRLRERQPERLIETSWSSIGQQRYLAPIIITAMDRTGLMRDVAAVVADVGINMTAVGSTTHQSTHTALITATLELDSLDQMRRIFTRLERVRGVVQVERDLR
jgi:guanosine-3',5'-bis(diphosphate) 3'-pyrophosphohydrolase